MHKSNFDNIINHKDLLQVLANSSPRHKKAILKSADKKLVKTICDIFFNLLKGNINISDSEKLKLKTHRKFFRKFIEKSSFRDKKKILEQKGSGILGLVLPAVISTLAEVLFRK